MPFIHCWNKVKSADGKTTTTCLKVVAVDRLVLSGTMDKAYEGTCSSCKQYYRVIQTMRPPPPKEPAPGTRGPGQ